MKFDFDLLRSLLMYIDQNAHSARSGLSDIFLEGWTDKEITYHVMLSEEADFISASFDEIPDAIRPYIIKVTYRIDGMTVKGHELVRIIREPERWQSIKADIESAVDMTIHALGSYVRAYNGDETNKRFRSDLN